VLVVTSNAFYRQTSRQAKFYTTSG
jgi:hypothetical protein